MAQDIKTVGVIGLGKMGHPIARHLARNGFAVLGHDIDPAAAQRLSQYGVTAAPSPAALAAVSDLVIVVTAFETEVEDVLFAANGVAAGAKAGTIVGIAATISPRGMRRFGERLSERGLVALDIPLCRGEPAAEAGQLLIVGGGDGAAFERCRPALATFADAIFHLGPAGQSLLGNFAVRSSSLRMMTCFFPPAASSAETNELNTNKLNTAAEKLINFIFVLPCFIDLISSLIRAPASCRQP